MWLLSLSFNYSNRQIEKSDEWIQLNWLKRHENLIKFMLKLLCEFTLIDHVFEAIFSMGPSCSFFFFV